MTHWLIAAMITLRAAAGGAFGREGIVGFDRLDFWMPDGSVRQVIEVSRDGADWRVTFNALYVRRP